MRGKATDTPGKERRRRVESKNESLKLDRDDEERKSASERAKPGSRPHPRDEIGEGVRKHRKRETVEEKERKKLRGCECSGSSESRHISDEEENTEKDSTKTRGSRPLLCLLLLLGRRFWREVSQKRLNEGAERREERRRQEEEDKEEEETR